MLDILGVPLIVLTNHPTTEADTSYPPKFRTNEALRIAWTRLCLASPMSLSPADAWNLVLRRFIAWTAKQGLVFIAPHVNRVDNSRMQSYLRLRRRWITQYLDGLGVLRGVVWNKVERTVREESMGITVNSSLHCRNVDYDGLRKLFEAERWRPNLTSGVGYDLGYRDWWRWIKVSETGITRVGFSAAGKERGIFWYTVFVPAHPKTPVGRTVEDTVLDDLWDPVVRELRFRSLSRISSF